MREQNGDCYRFLERSGRNRKLLSLCEQDEAECWDSVFMQLRSCPRNARNAPRNARNARNVRNAVTPKCQIQSKGGVLQTVKFVRPTPSSSRICPKMDLDLRIRSNIDLDGMKRGQMCVQILSPRRDLQRGQRP